MFPLFTPRWISLMPSAPLAVHHKRSSPLRSIGPRIDAPALPLTLLIS